MGRRASWPGCVTTAALTSCAPLSRFGRQAARLELVRKRIAGFLHRLRTSLSGQAAYGLCQQVIGPFRVAAP
jgi:hypothetical protein